MGNIEITTPSLSSPERLALLQRSQLVEGPAEPAFDRLTRLAATVLKTSAAHITFVVDTAEYLKSHHGLLPPAIKGRGPWPISPLRRHILQSNEPLVINNITGHSLAAETPDEIFYLSFLGIPIVNPDGSVLGVFSVADTRPRRWSRNDIAILTDLAACAVAEIDLRTERRLRQRFEASQKALASEVETAAADSPDFLRRLGRELSRKMDINYVLMIALDTAIRLSLADAGYIGLVEDNQLRLTHIIGDYSGTMKVNTLLPIDTGAIGRAVKRGKIEYLPDVNDDPEYIPWLPETRAKIVAPLIVDRNLIGVLNLETNEPEHFDPETVKMIDMLSIFIASTAYNTRLHLEAQKQLGEIQSRIDELNAYNQIVAHDLRAPLSNIISFCEFIMEDYGDEMSDIQQKYFDKIYSSGVKMSTMITQLLHLAQLQNAHAAASLVPIPPIIDSVISRFERDIELSRVKIVVEDKLPDSVGHGPWIEEVFANLVSNAIKYIGKENPEPRITIRGIRDGEMVRYEVEDNGIGIGDEDQSKVFGMFTRVNKSDGLSGFGLGLSIVQNIIKNLHGQVGLRSQLGKGSTFWFTLPAEVETDPDETQPARVSQK